MGQAAGRRIDRIFVTRTPREDGSVVLRGEIGVIGSTSFAGHTVIMTPEMVQDDWEPDCRARIVRMIKMQQAR